jgi:ATP-dependent DNA helicase RecG
MAQLYSEDEILLALPRTYIDLSVKLKRLYDCPEDKLVVIELTVTSKLLKQHPRRCVAIKCTDSIGQSTEGTVYAEIWRWNNIQPGDVVQVRAKKAVYAGKPVLVSPVLIEEMVRVEAVYSPAVLVSGGESIKLNPKEVLQAVRTRLARPNALRVVSAHICAHVGVTESYLARQIGVTSIQEWLKTVHNPRTIEDARHAWKAAKRLAVLHIYALASQSAQPTVDVRSAVHVEHFWADRWMKASAITPTGDQLRVTRTIFESIRAPIPLRALVHGDVGVGKSLPMYLAAAAVAKAGRIAVIIVPRDILITKTGRELRALAPDIDVLEYRNGEKFVRPVEGGVFVGTHALNAVLNKREISVRFLAIDEQHKFSRSQREALVQPFTNMLEVSATPIPRSFGLLVTGGRQLLELKESPFKKDIRTFLINRDDRDRLIALIRRTVAHPKAVAMVVYPLIEGGADNAPELSKLSVAMEQWRLAFPGQVVELHGKMDRAEQQTALDKLMRGEAKIACVTTVAELGITVENLTAMVVVQPDRLGADQLHQLRGRLARHGGAAIFAMYCLQPPSEKALERLGWLVSTNDGYEISEKVFMARGSGDLAVDSVVQDGKTLSVLPSFPIKPGDLLKYKPTSGTI